MMTYTIIISEAQRVALLQVIKSTGKDTTDAPLEYWVSMLTELPEDERVTPGCLHGFCL